MSKFDPIELELFKNSFLSIADEMGAVLGRTAFSPNIKERKDYSCALFNEKGETFAQGTHIPVHLGAMPLSVKAALSKLTFGEGDIVLLNDPYEGGTHLPDITCITPLFIDGVLRFFVANRAHHSDVGGITPGSMPLATEIYQEGLRIPPIRIATGDDVDEDVMNLILANVRTPAERRGDLMAQIAANRKGITRLREVIEKNGLEKISAYTENVQDYSEKIFRSMLESIPDGSYSFHDYMDDDGISLDTVKIAVKITIEKDTVTVDFTGSDKQTRGGINANLAVTYSAVMYVFRSLVEEEIPINTGLSRPIDIIAPKGTIVNASFPAATAGGNVETSQRIVDVMLGALSRAVPEKIPAASQGTMNNIAIGGWDENRKRPFAYYETIGGGTGASVKSHGMDGVHSHMTNSLNTPAEALELYMPVRISRYCLREGSGGKGLRRGGEGILREYEFLQDMELSIISERRNHPPYGLSGGEAGRQGENILLRDGTEARLKSKENLQVKKGDKIIIKTPGGGGYGREE